VTPCVYIGVKYSGNAYIVCSDAGANIDVYINTASWSTATELYYPTCYEKPLGTAYYSYYGEVKMCVDGDLSPYTCPTTTTTVAPVTTTTTTVQTYSISLAYSDLGSGVTCGMDIYTDFYIDEIAFPDATKLYANVSGTVYANDGWYRVNGSTYWRYWNGLTFGISGNCPISE
ncbi:hypothetical protein M0Q97_05905, partial [Candidatus Dojkabacteria bacterium]|nr:hypothetical protein [Candidatus Dojkabacteria bacterium]